MNLLVLLSLACSPPVDATDADGDGFFAEENDCNDADAAINPDGTEACNGLDDDCDGTADEDLDTFWWLDTDGDGYGDADLPMSACEPPAGAVDNNDDCDDGDAAVHPDAAELCNGADENCDGTADEGVTIVVYEDADGDGYGDAARSTEVCEATGGQVTNDQDCDDGNTAIHPDAPETDCTDATDYNCDGSVAYADADADGFAACQDCDDSDNTRSPSASETCNETDDDCDGTVDEDATDALTWYADTDGDTYGDASSTAAACDAPAGFVAGDTDCDDGDAAVHPDAVELCDEADQDCDGTVDEGATTTWYGDRDADGYGDATDTLDACSAPANYVGDATDCDGADAAVYPGAAEACNGEDDDCDGAIDESGASGETTWYADVDGDGYGAATSTLSACDLPAGYTANATDCNDSSASISPADTEVCDDGVDQDCDGTADDGCVVTYTHCGTISADETWSGGGDIHVVTCDVYVQGAGAPWLTIEDGATVQLAPGAGIYVGASNHGGLEVTGTSDGVTFTSTSSHPTAGAWDGLWFGAYDRGSWVEGATVEYGGGNGYAGIVLSGADLVSLVGTTVTDASGHGVGVYSAATLEMYRSNATDNSADGVYLDTTSSLVDGRTATFTDNTLSGNGSYSLALPPDSVGELDATSSFVGNDEEEIYVHAGTVSDDASWQHLDAPLLLAGDTYVASALTIEDGAELRFDSGAGLWVGQYAAAELYVLGSTLGVSFTSASSRPRAGDWDGVYFGGYVEGAEVAGATIAYGGGNGAGNVYIGSTTNTDAIHISDSTISDSSTSGIYLTWYGVLELDDSTVQDNDDYGVYVFDYATLSGDGTWGGNTITGNDVGFSAPAMDGGALLADGAYTGNVSDDVVLRGDIISDDTTLRDLDAPWHVTGDVAVAGTTTARLTITDGARLEFDSNTGLTIGWAGYGELVTQGSSAGVTFTSADATPAPGDWDGLTFAIQHQHSQLSGATVSYAGQNGTASVYLSYASYNGGTIELDDCVITEGSRTAIYAYETDDIWIHDTTVSEHDGYGLYLGAGSSLETTGGPTFTGNTITGNTDYPVLVYAGDVKQLDASSTFTGNGTDRVYVTNATVSQDATWQDLDVPYEMHGDTLVEGVASPILTIEPGTTLLFEVNASLQAGTFNYGELQALGTNTAPIVFTSAQPVPAGGDWDGLYFGTNDSGTVLDQVEVSYGGGSVANVRTNENGSRVTVSNSLIAYSAGYGVYSYLSTPTLSGNSYVGNAGASVYP